MPRVTDRLVAVLDTSLMEQVLDISEREEQPDIKHHCQADDLEDRLVTRRRFPAPLPASGVVLQQRLFARNNL